MFTRWACPVRRGEENMSDLEDDPDLSGFKDEAEAIRPIDVAGGGPAKSARVAYDIRAGNLRAKTVPGEELLVEDEDKIRNIVKKGDFIDLLKLVPSLTEIVAGTGWELKNLEGDKIDVDLSCFLIDKTGQTRSDDDFVFYNQQVTLEGAVKHLGDSRTGDGEGDDESIFLALNSIPFDVVRIALVLSIYDDTVKGWNFGMVRDMFLHLIDKTQEHEVLLVRLNEDDFAGQTAILVGSLVREGPKWFFEVLEKPVPGGLAAIAKQHGIIVREDTG